jgi:hypothetical protein
MSYIIFGSRTNKTIDSGREEEKIDHNVGYLLKDMNIRHCFFYSYKKKKKKKKPFYLIARIYSVWFGCSVSVTKNYAAVLR